MPERKQDSAHDYYLYSQGEMSPGKHPSSRGGGVARDKEKRKLKELRKRGDPRQKKMLGRV